MTPTNSYCRPRAMGTASWWIGHGLVLQARIDLDVLLRIVVDRQPGLLIDAPPAAPITILSLTGSGAAVSANSGCPSPILVSQATLPVSLSVAITRAG